MTRPVPEYFEEACEWGVNGLGNVLVAGQWQVPEPPDRAVYGDGKLYLIRRDRKMAALRAPYAIGERLTCERTVLLVHFGTGGEVDERDVPLSSAREAVAGWG